MATITTTKGVLNGDGRGNFKFEIDVLSDLLSPQELVDFENEKNALQAANNEGNFRLSFYMVIIDGNVELPIEVYFERASNPLVRVRFISRVGETPAFDHQPYLRGRYDVGDVIELERVGARRFRIV
jgi:hypothetical protein